MNASHDDPETDLGAPLRIEMAGATDVGRVRSRNEDFLQVLPAEGMAILADGMGGHRAGDVASRMAVEILGEELAQREGAPDEMPDKDALSAALKTANDAIRTVSRNEPDCFGMGATVVVAVFRGARFTAAHMGDSRLYRYADSAIDQLTEDHTLAQQYVRRGLMSRQEAKTSAGRNMLVKGLGIEKRVAPDIVSGALNPGDVFLLCSDGLSDVVPETELAAALSKAAAAPLQSVADRLVKLANDHGGPDNISVIVVRASEAL